MAMEWGEFWTLMLQVGIGALIVIVLAFVGSAIGYAVWSGIKEDQKNDD